MRRALGKGLAQLLGEQADSGVLEVSVDSLVPNQRQPRTSFDEQSLDDLAASIREHGLLQPILVRPIAEGKYEVIAGERRLRACKRAGLAQIPVIVRAAGAQTSLELALIENLQREDIGPLESARAYRQLADEFGLKQEEIAVRVGKARATVTNALRLLKLPEEVRTGLEAGAITEGHARAILGVEGASAQVALYRRVVAKGMNVRETERAAQPAERQKRPPSRSTRPVVEDADRRALEEGLSIYLGSPVRIERAEAGGRMVIEFYSDDDLQRILDVLCVHL
ncbi:MAG TPA: ParB/RepB/Spo0J family partition protein [Fimbriimonadaceae bacterium]|nr:ParB/RepB/Spo0J family partition protein [Fimbriimonadaceae bacterium]HRJ95574.1 ParB/RepB/Spo0J family partition protein [Fimbriimonadaceae bacterium]